MKSLLSVEEKLGRKRFKKNDPRTCDIDIIDFHGKIINKKIDNFELNIPHQKMTERNFVLYPNNEITKLSQNDINSHVKWRRTN